MADIQQPAPYFPFRFRLDFKEQMVGQAPEGELAICSGAFSECSGLEASLEPKVIKEGGRNWGAAQRAGKVTFSTVILKRGITQSKDLWAWFEYLGNGHYGHRVEAVVTMFDTAGKGVMAWTLSNAMPIKFKTADLNAKASDIAIEEIHLAHEGLARASAAKETLFEEA
ncbi:conserved hypothetical phage tail region protein [Alteromonadaceae bacterium Bs31]|nr:conserved hypothetical phage tail region protein [Alteromonadaceae bacterium Bs31]